MEHTILARGNLVSIQHVFQHIDDTIYFFYRAVVDQRHPNDTVIDVNFGVQFVHDAVRVKVTISHSDLPLMTLSRGGSASKIFIAAYRASFVAPADNDSATYILRNEADCWYARASIIGVANDEHARRISS